MTSFDRIPLKDRCVGKWRSLLPMLGLSASFLTGKQTPCPMCGGKDRFHFSDKRGEGLWYCNHCEGGDGVELVKQFLKVEFEPAARAIEAVLGDAVFAVPKAAKSMGDRDAWLDRKWRLGFPLDGRDPASLYLINRGLSMDVWPSELRFTPQARYLHDDKTMTTHPALMARFWSPSTDAMTLHVTYLTPDGYKAKVPSVRKLAAARVPKGGAVRLCKSAPSMGIAEGIETALSAQRIFGIPVWATLSADGLLKWDPPPSVRHVTIFGDADRKYAGQHKAYGLAYRLSMAGVETSVALPPDIGTDWNDSLRAETTFLRDTSVVV